MNYVVHYCRNKECNNAWIDKDITNVKTYPPMWKYCKKCCKKLGIDFNKQTPMANASEAQKKVYEKGRENLKKPE